MCQCTRKYTFQADGERKTVHIQTRPQVKVVRWYVR